MRSLQLEDCEINFKNGSNLWGRAVRCVPAIRLAPFIIIIEFSSPCPEIRRVIWPSQAAPPTERRSWKWPLSACTFFGFSFHFFPEENPLPFLARFFPLSLSFLGNASYRYIGEIHHLSFSSWHYAHEILQRRNYLTHNHPTLTNSLISWALKLLC